jgi:hypothetical protein|tara:strand:+ start:171 stop:644 length:474 start_codon:yes stop_codon:yes gene_type:complete
MTGFMDLTDADLALILACVVMALALIRLSLAASRADPAEAARLVAELRLAQFAALMLVLTAGVYVGFALAHGSSPGSGLDVALAVGFLVLASVAITQEPGHALTILALGFAGHAVVDLLHGAGTLPSSALPNWYATACAIYDVGIAGVCYLPIVRRP